MNNPFEYVPEAGCAEAFVRLQGRLEALQVSGSAADRRFVCELEAGKMLGVLIAVDERGERQELFAFSGQIGDAGFHQPGFVGPVFDYLQPAGHFKTKEAEISALNAEIERFERNELSAIREEFEGVKESLDKEIEAFKDVCRQSKSERAARRMSGDADEGELAAMIRQSQFEKAELRRLKKSVAERLSPYAERLKRAQTDFEALKGKRRRESEALQHWLFSNFMLLNARGESRSVLDIFAETPLRIPPSGAGECCAPKLLQEAYRRGWRPVAMAEYWYGRPKQGEVRIHGRHYPACRGKCLPILRWMLQGLDVEPPIDADEHCSAISAPRIIFENQWFCVVDKPAGMLSVPGKGAAISVQQWLIDRYGADRYVKAAHRLDRDTSGLLIATFGDQSYKQVQALFATRRVKKVYVATLEGDYIALGKEGAGRIELPLSPDWLDRPRQRVDMENGKEAITVYEFTGTSAGRSRVKFQPLTGRTHQLRMHAASEQGLGMPIAGDRLYGRSESASRLCLHAHRIEFVFPEDGLRYEFESPVPF